MMLTRKTERERETKKGSIRNLITYTWLCMCLGGIEEMTQGKEGHATLTSDISGGNDGS